MTTVKHKSKKSTGKTNPAASSKRPNQRPENTHSSQKDELLYPQEAETGNQREGVDATFTERNDVTPPNRREFPSVGAAKTDFESRPHGRTTGRMIGHEPGTENI